MGTKARRTKERCFEGERTVQRKWEKHEKQEAAARQRDQQMNLCGCLHGKLSREEEILNVASYLGPIRPSSESVRWLHQFF
jgi:phosphopantetheinyl transferase